MSSKRSPLKILQDEEIRSKITQEVYIKNHGAFQTQTTITSLKTSHSRKIVTLGKENRPRSSNVDAWVAYSPLRPVASSKKSASKMLKLPLDREFGRSVRASSTALEDGARVSASKVQKKRTLSLSSNSKDSQNIRYPLRDSSIKNEVNITAKSLKTRKQSLESSKSDVDPHALIESLKADFESLKTSLEATKSSIGRTGVQFSSRSILPLCDKEDMIRSRSLRSNSSTDSKFNTASSGSFFEKQTRY